MDTRTPIQQLKDTFNIFRGGKIAVIPPYKRGQTTRFIPAEQGHALQILQQQQQQQQGLGRGQQQQQQTVVVQGAQPQVIYEAPIVLPEAPTVWQRIPLFINQDTRLDPQSNTYRIVVAERPARRGLARRLLGP